ncbi:Hypothetical protein NGAL_HAMBI1145_24360 [Neorhizobium galegae bv. officinalis]|uniref:Uncharacterized protein n=1 Tax=Neorhizobium galegae bv. officinalis TaxID=323656 RepID=A0A0T7FI00_NEOGA|nr:Hypothetical protein NGAL_HAMBI1145_24360 [Neorhizobium galegae bv. officinalis]
METALEDDQPRLVFAALHAVDEPVFLGYPARPMPIESPSARGQRKLGALLPYGLVQVINSKMLLVPFCKPSRVGCPEEYTTNSNNLRHGSSLYVGQDNARGEDRVQVKAF